MIEFSASTLATAMIVLEALVLLTNVLVEIFKGCFDGPIPVSCLNTVAFIFAEAVTIACSYTVSVIFDVEYTLLVFIGSFVLGTLVAYAAMFGYDKLLGGLFAKLGELVRSEGK